MVGLASLRLMQHRRIAGHPAGGELLQDELVCARHAAWCVNVFDANQPLPTVGACIKPTGQRSNERARMQRARGRGGKSTDVAQGRLQTLGRLANRQGQFQAGDKGVFDAVAQVPVTAGAQTALGIVLV